MPTNRLENLSDGVFAIAVTLLVLDLRIPQGLGFSPEELKQFLLGGLDDLLVFMVAFLILAVIWSLHHRMFHLLERVDGTLFWVNMLQLMFVVLVPFSTSVMSDYSVSLEAELLFGANVFCIGVLFIIGWARAARGCRLIDPNLEPVVIRWMYQRCLIVPVVSLVVMVVAVFTPEWAPLVYGLIALQLIPGHKIRQWFSAFHRIT
jgi:uncharacterized membrane protein